MRRKTPISRKPKSEEPKFRFNARSADLPATQGMLHLVRNELKSEMKAGFRQMDSRFADMESRFADMESRFAGHDSKFASIESRFAQIDSRFAQIDSRFAQVDSKLEKVLSEVSRLALLVEEQNSRNRVVLEGLTALWQRQDRVETRVDQIEEVVRSIARTRS